MKSLTNNFTLDELTHTNQPIVNIPNSEQIKNLTELCVHVLQPLREKLKSSITINSGFRSLALNEAVNGASTSQHLYGQAADIDCLDNAAAFAILRTMKFDQLIWEGGNDEQPAWIHVSYGPRMRNQVLKMKKGKYTPF